MEFSGAALFAFFFSAKGAGFDARSARPSPLSLIRTPDLLGVFFFLSCEQIRLLRRKRRVAHPQLHTPRQLKAGMEFSGAALFAFLFSAKGAGFDARSARPSPLSLIRTPGLLGVFFFLSHE
jgi:hypothetical protein